METRKDETSEEQNAVGKFFQSIFHVFFTKAAEGRKSAASKDKIRKPEQGEELTYENHEKDVENLFSVIIGSNKILPKKETGEKYVENVEQSRANIDDDDRHNQDAVNVNRIINEFLYKELEGCGLSEVNKTQMVAENLASIPAKKHSEGGHDNISAFDSRWCSATQKQKAADSLKSYMRSTEPLVFKNEEGHFCCSLCKWKSSDNSFQSFLGHCKTNGHKSKLKQRFPEQNFQEACAGTKGEPQERIIHQEKKQVKFKENISKETFSSNQTQNSRIGQNLEPTSTLQDFFVGDTPKKLQNKQIKKNKNQNDIQENKLFKETTLSRVQPQAPKIKVGKPAEKKFPVPQPNSKQEGNKSVKSEIMLNENPFILSMMCIQIDPQSSFKCTACNKIIPRAANLINLIKNVSFHVQSEKHLNKLLDANKTQNEL